MPTVQPIRRAQQAIWCKRWLKNPGGNLQITSLWLFIQGLETIAAVRSYIPMPAASPASPNPWLCHPRWRFFGRQCFTAGFDSELQTYSQRRALSESKLPSYRFQSSSDRYEHLQPLVAHIFVVPNLLISSERAKPYLDGWLKNVKGRIRERLKVHSWLSVTSRRSGSPLASKSDVAFLLPRQSAGASNRPHSTSNSQTKCV